MKLLSAVSLFILCVACTQRHASKIPNIYASVSFREPSGTSENSQFREMLMSYVEHHQIRNAAAGVDIGQFGEADYKVDILGGCANAVSDVRAAVSAAARNLGAAESSFVKSYDATAVCVEKQVPQPEHK